jgi:hypothetical protein
MKSNVKKSILATLMLIGSLVNWVPFAEALDVKLLWKKEFINSSIGVILARGPGDLLISKANKGSVAKEVILYDKGGNERFHWGPRMDRRVGPMDLSEDGKYFAFRTGYTEEYAERKNIHVLSGERVHFYDRQTKKELWSKSIGEESLMIFPDGLSMVIYGYESGNFEIYDRQGKKMFDQNQGAEIRGISISADSNFFVLAKEVGKILLYKRDGTKLWEKGSHKEGVASICAGASYISTYPY